jgi:hypothetical protein
MRETTSPLPLQIIWAAGQCLAYVLSVLLDLPGPLHTTPSHPLIPLSLSLFAYSQQVFCEEFLGGEFSELVDITFTIEA